MRGTWRTLSRTNPMRKTPRAWHRRGVLGYVRVSSDEQASSGAGLEAQRRTILAECERRGWQLVSVIEDAGYSAKDMRRPGVQEALQVLKAGRADALVVARLDRLSRSMLDFSRVMHVAQKQHSALIALDVGVDSSSPSGEAMANMLATFAQFERRLIGERTKAALAVKRAQGVRLGRPPTVPQAVVRRIQRQRARGHSLRRIADSLNQAGVPTAQGGAKWYAATVRGVLARSG
jgi:DNA invertase Pin-like site-specific DNA recombinase